MANISKPNTFSSSTTISSSEVNDNFDTIYNEFNGNIAAANLATDSVVTAKIADSAVTAAKLASDAVTTAKILDANVTSAKLAEGFFRGRYQEITTNTQPTGLTVQFGWTYYEGDGTAAVDKSITFGTAFSSAPFIIASPLGANTSTEPNSIDDFNAAIGNASVSSVPYNIATTGCTIKSTRSAGTFSTSDWFGISWIAIGTV